MTEHRAPYKSTTLDAKSHFFWIDILRGLAAFAVVIYHCRVDLWVGYREITKHPALYGTLDHWTAYLSAPVPFFRSGVMLFFLISGFCIHYSYAGDDKQLLLRSYFIRRFCRIYPPYLVALLLSILVEYLCHKIAHYPTSATSKIIETVFMVQNYGADPFQMKGDPALWSLPIEMELYLLYPIFWFLLQRRGLKVAFSAVTLTSMAALSVILSTPFLRERYEIIGQVGNSLMYWVIWCGGAWLAVEVRNGRNHTLLNTEKLLLVFSVAAGAASTILNWKIEFQEILWGTFWFLVLRTGLRHAHLLQTMPRTLAKTFSILGTMSYSLYLIHFPFFKLCSALWLRTVDHPQGDFLVAVLFAFLVLPFAFLFYLFFERPFHALARKYGAISDLKYNVAATKNVEQSYPA